MPTHETKVCNVEGVYVCVYAATRGGVSFQEVVIMFYGHPKGELHLDDHANKELLRPQFHYLSQLAFPTQFLNLCGW